MKHIRTLVPDIYKVLEDQKLSKDAVESFGSHLARRLSDRLVEQQDRATLRMSNFAQPDRKLWYTVNKPDVAAPLEGQARHKFLYGDIIEEEVLFLAEQAGHEVKHRGLDVSYHGVPGHIDGIIDGVLVDCKSASSRGFDKFRRHRLGTDDPFGYLDQLSLYLESLQDHPDLKIKNEFAFIAINKETGEICLDIYRKKEFDYKKEIVRKNRMLSGNQLPARCYPDIPYGASGNRKLPMECSYCPFADHCWADANGGRGLRRFAYSAGVVALTDVKREPEVEEII